MLKYVFSDDYKCAGCGKNILSYDDDWQCNKCGCVTAERKRVLEEEINE